MVRCIPHADRRAHGFPRASGDGPWGAMRLCWCALFPPRERGWSRRHRYIDQAAAVSPARAGMVPPVGVFALVQTSFPRASGDGPEQVREFYAIAMFPPRERGWSLDAGLRPDR